VSAAGGAPLFTRADALPLALLFAGSAGLVVAVAVAVSRATGLPLSALAVFYDGHIYLEIARSFPLPYAREGLDYMGHAPGYPAAAWLLRVLTPDALFDWGTLLLLASWLPAGLSTVTFYLLSREVGAPAFLGAAAFAVLNPRWVSVSATAHPEPLAMLLAMLALLASLRGRLVPAVSLLSACVLTRYPALLLGLPIGWIFLITRRGWSVSRVAWLCSPLLAFGALNFYLHARVPGFGGISEAHSVFWQTGLDWPFRALVRNADPSVWSTDVPLFEVTYASVLLYAAAFVVGFRPREREHFLLPVWVGIVVLVHVSLEGVIGAWDFTRLVVLAWPAAWLIVWRLVGARIPASVAAGVVLAAAVFSFWFSTAQLRTAVDMQRSGPVFEFLRETIEDLDGDEPRWIDFHLRYRARHPAPRTQSR